MPLKDPAARSAYHKQYMKNRYDNDPEFKKSHLAKVKKVSEKHMNEIRLIINDFKSQGCKVCDEKEFCALDCHHLNPQEKEFTIGDTKTKSLAINKFKAEISKCICLCKNCHAKLHDGIIQVIAE